MCIAFRTLVILYTAYFMYFVCLWLIPHPAVSFTNLWINCVCVCMYVCIYEHAVHSDSC